MRQLCGPCQVEVEQQGQLLGWLPKAPGGQFIAGGTSVDPCGMTAVSVSLGFGRVMSVKDARRWMLRLRPASRLSSTNRTSTRQSRCHCRRKDVA